MFAYLRMTNLFFIGILFYLFCLTNGSFYVYFNKSPTVRLLPDSLMTFFNEPKNLRFHTVENLYDPYTDEDQWIKYYYCDASIDDFKHILNKYKWISLEYLKAQNDNDIKYADDCLSHMSLISRNVPKDKDIMLSFIVTLETLPPSLAIQETSFERLSKDDIQKWRTHKFLPAVINSNLEISGKIPEECDSFSKLCTVKVKMLEKVRLYPSISTVIIKKQKFHQLSNLVKDSSSLCSFDQLCETQLYLTLDSKIATNINGKRAVLLDRLENSYEIIGYVSEYFNRGTLYQYSKYANNKIASAKFLKALQALFKTLHELHTAKIVHNHISLSTIYVHYDDVLDSFHLALGDLVFAQKFDNESEEFERLKSEDWYNISFSTFQLVKRMVKRNAPSSQSHITYLMASSLNNYYKDANVEEKASQLLKDLIKAFLSSAPIPSDSFFL